MEPVELVSNLNELYNGAFSNLITVTFGVIALIGIVIPAAATWIQIRALKSERAVIKAELEKELNDLHSNLSTSLKNEIIELSKQIKSEVNERIENIDASTFHIQGLIGLENEHYSIVIEDFVSAAIGYIRSNDEMNAQRCLKVLTSECLSNINKHEYEEFNISNEIDRIIAFLTKNDINGRYTNSIDLIQREARDASRREKPSAKDPE